MLAGAVNSVALRGDGTIVAWGDNAFGQTNVPAGLSDVVSIAAGNGFSLALKRDGSDGRMLVVDRFGLRAIDSSDRIWRRALAYVRNDLARFGGSLNQAGNALKAWHLLLENVATYALSDALSKDDVLHSLLFGRDCLLDTDSGATLLNDIVMKNDWRPLHHFDLGALALSRIDVLQSRIVKAVSETAARPNPVKFLLVTDTLNGLKLLLATHDALCPLRQCAWRRAIARCKSCSMVIPTPITCCSRARTCRPGPTGRRLTQKRALPKLILPMAPPTFSGPFKLNDNSTSEVQPVIFEVDEAVEYGLAAPKGLVIVGIPGTGKSLTAKATAKVFGVRCSS